MTPTESTSASTNSSSALRRVGSALSGVAAAAVIALAVVIGAAALAGYRPVVITTGSMGSHAPSGSVVVAAPSSAVEVGDVVVMRRDGRATVTHRIIEIERHGDQTFAITKGDANEEPDAAPYPLGDDELVGRTVIPYLGDVLLAADDPAATMLVLTVAVLAVAVMMLRRIWRPAIDTPPAPLVARRPKGRRRLTAATIALIGLLGGGVAWSVYSASDSVAGNVFSTPPCFDAQLASVQHGQVVSSVDGTQTVPIAAVDPTTSFLTFSTRSSSNEPADSMVQGRLLDPTTIELTRRTDAAVPVPVVVDWSVVEYGCGLTVQRGVTAGNDLSVLDVAIGPVDTQAAFVLLSAVGAPTDTDFDGNALAIAELTSSTNLRLRSMSPAIVRSVASYAWQVVSFNDPTDVRVQTTSVILGAASGASLSIAGVDPGSTFVLASTATASSGPDLSERAIRAHLSSPTSVAVARKGSGDPIEVHVQVVELRDGSRVEHGTIDLLPGVPARTVAVGPLDPGRTTAFSTVQVPGSQSGGLTGMLTDDVIGEASATFELTDPTTVTITRNATTDEGSFGWQAIEWGGPPWWDPTSPFRQRIDVTTSSAAAPGGYSAPVVLDHAALVASALSIPSGNDLRVLRWDGSSWTELDRVLDDASSWNLADSTFWFRTIDPIATSTTTSYWLYFGNPTPPPPLDDPENVWLLSEGFESGTLGDFEDRTTGSGWYQADTWSRRIPVTIAAGAVGADLTDFTVLVDVTDADLSAAQLDGSDIRFTAADGVTPRPHEIEMWDPGTGSLTAWVHLPTLPRSSATTLYLYYGAANAPAQDDPRSTWPTEVAGAWHLSRDPAGPAPQADDSTIRNHDGVSRGAMTGGDLVAGLVGDAIDFDGSDDRFDLGAWELSTFTEATVSAWVNLDSFATNGRVFTKGGAPPNQVVELSHQGSQGRARISLGGSTTEVTGGALSIGAWHHLAAVWDGTFLHLYVDGSPVAAAPAYGVLDTDGSMDVTIGDLGGGTRALDGRIDEVRLESVGRSNAWLSAVEKSQRVPTAFAVPGAPQAGSWFGQGTWSARKPIVVDADQVDATLTDHTLLVQITDTDIAAAAQGDGDDILFTAADGVTRLDHEIELWNSIAGDLTAWVRVPVLDGTVDTLVFVYFGNGAATDQQDPAGVFGTDADAIAHLGG